MTTTVYTNPACMPCEQTKKYLTLKGIPFDVVDLSEDAEALQMVSDLGFKQAPVVITDDDKWSGFRLDRLAALVEKSA